MEKTCALLLFLMLSISSQSQSVKGYRVQSQPLEFGMYNPKKVVKNSFKVFYNEKAEKEFKKLLRKDDELRARFMLEGVNEAGKAVYFMEEEIYEYYPKLGIIIKGGGHGNVSVFDVRSKEYVCGNPMTYAYSPSLKYRLSGLDADGMHYYLEELIDGKYTCLGSAYFEENVSSYYWANETTIYYLREVENDEGSKYWAAYSCELSIVD